MNPKDFIFFLLLFVWMQIGRVCALPLSLRYKIIETTTARLVVPLQQYIHKQKGREKWKRHLAPPKRETNAIQTRDRARSWAQTFEILETKDKIPKHATEWITSFLFVFSAKTFIRQRRNNGLFLKNIYNNSDDRPLPSLLINVVEIKTQHFIRPLSVFINSLSPWNNKVSVDVHFGEWRHSCSIISAHLTALSSYERQRAISSFWRFPADVWSAWKTNKKKVKNPLSFPFVWG